MQPLEFRLFFLFALAFQVGVRLQALLLRFKGQGIERTKASAPPYVDVAEISVNSHAGMLPEKCKYIFTLPIIGFSFRGFFENAHKSLTVFVTHSDGCLELWGMKYFEIIFRGLVFTLFGDCLQNKSSKALSFSRFLFHALPEKYKQWRTR